MILNVQKVQSTDIQKVVKQYLVDDQLTVAILDPQPIKKGSSPLRATPSGMRH